MAATIILFTFFGWLSYWLVKVPGTIFDESPVRSIGDFFKKNWKQFVFSIMGLIMLFTGGNQIPESWGRLDTGPLPAFFAGGSIPSIIMNVVALLGKTQTNANQ